MRMSRKLSTFFFLLLQQKEHTEREKVIAVVTTIYKLCINTYGSAYKNREKMLHRKWTRLLLCVVEPVR